MQPTYSDAEIKSAIKRLNDRIKQFYVKDATESEQFYTLLGIPKPKNGIPSKKQEKENDIYLQDYLKFKKEFHKISLVLGVKFSKNDTSKFVSILKPYKPKYKNLNPIKHSKDSNENIYLTKFSYDEKSILENDILNTEKI